jgi:hypothetical protein
MMAEDAQSMGVFSVSPSGLSRETPNASRAQTLPAAGIEPPMMREAEPPTFDPALVKLVAEADAQVATPPALDVPPITIHAADSTVLAARAQLDAGQVDIDLEAPKDLEPLAFEPASVSSAKVTEKATAKPTGNATENATEKPTANAAQPTDISPRVAATLLPDLPEQPYTRTIVMPPKGKAPTTQVAPAFNVPAPAPEAPVVPREPAAARDSLSMSGPMATLPAASGPIKRDQDEDKTVLLDPRLARQTTNVPDGLQIEFVGDTTGALAVGSEFPAADASSAPVDFDFDKKTVILDKPAIIDFDSFTTTVKPADKQPPAAAMTGTIGACHGCGYGRIAPGGSAGRYRHVFLPGPRGVWRSARRASGATCSHRAGRSRCRPGFRHLRHHTASCARQQRPRACRCLP